MTGQGTAHGTGHGTLQICGGHWIGGAHGGGGHGIDNCGGGHGIGHGGSCGREPPHCPNPFKRVKSMLQKSFN